jgi:Polyketide cyclase / dehydrase and lipid transport
MVANERPRTRNPERRRCRVNIAGEIVINRPIDVVFDFVADERNEPRYNPRLRRVEQTTPCPIGLGTRFRAETTATMGHTAEMVIEWTDFDRPRRLASSTHMSAMDIHGTLTFDPVPAGTRMRWWWEITPRGLLRLVRPMVACLGQRQERANWAGLKHYLEEYGPARQRGTSG